MMVRGRKKPGTFRVEMVRGEPYVVGGQKLTPMARITTFGKAKATIGAKRIGGWTGGFDRVTPLAIVEETGGREHRIPITDATSAALWRMLGVAVVMVLFFSVLRWLARRWCRDSLPG
jgi:hypothetical protein